MKKDNQLQIHPGEIKNFPPKKTLFPLILHLPSLRQFHLAWGTRSTQLHSSTGTVHTPSAAVCRDVPPSSKDGHLFLSLCLSLCLRVTGADMIIKPITNLWPTQLIAPVGFLFLFVCLSAALLCWRVEMWREALHLCLSISKACQWRL